MTPNVADAGLYFDVPLRGSNADHLDMFERAGASYGEGLGEQTGANLRLAGRLGFEPKVTSVSRYIDALRQAKVDSGSVLEWSRRLKLKAESPVWRYFIAVALYDIEGTVANLRRRGYRANQISRFRVSALVAFKRAIRASEQLKAN